MKCDYCNKPATVNYQKVWVKWNIDKKGNYSKNFKTVFDIDEPVGDNNVHLCGEHEKKFLKGEL